MVEGVIRAINKYYVPNCSGGSADMVVFLVSYFFGDEPFHLGDWYIRAENRVQRWWTFPYMPGSRYVNKDVYVLLSKSSFSAVEGFSTILQHHKRAVIVGESTRGGTHPGRFVRVHPNFAVFVPMSWFIYPASLLDRQARLPQTLRAQESSRT